MLVPSGGDDTLVIQASINAKGYAELDSGTFLVTSLNLTDRQGSAIIGKGSLSTKLQPTQNGVNVIDCTGTTNALMRDFRIAGHGAGVTPNTGILAAQKHGTATSDVFSLDGVRVDGNFGIAAFFCHGVQSSRMRGGQFYNYAGMTAVLTGNNFFGVTSQFTPISTANDMIVSDWEIEACEFHNFANGWALWLGGLQSVKFRGGNASSSAPILSNNAVVMAQGQVNPDKVILDGMTFYSDFPPTAPYALGGMTTPPHMIERDCSYHVPRT